MPTAASEPLKLQLKQGNELLAELELKSEPGTGPLVVNFECLMDHDAKRPVKFEDVPRRTDPLQTVVDALAAFGYSHSGRKPVKASKRTGGATQL
jgi:hypothetical protein